ncbi:hypothetical protein QWJ17_04075 [Betaproteobacteria bacterium LSUCC0117]|nr:hypothetical protein [Betaproteobacteria bacterium LSUCC0117]
MLVDLLETNWKRRFQKLLSTGSLSGIVAFNAVLGDLLSAELDIPYVACLVDAPHYHFDRLRSSLRRRHVFCAAKHHLNFIKESSLSANATVLLSGCETLPSDIPIGGPRVHGVLIAASWMGRPENFWSNFNDNRLIAISKESIELLNLNANVDAYQAVKSAAKINGANFEFNQFWMFLVSQVHNYIRKVDRIKEVESLVASGLPLTLVGSGWSEHIALGKNVTVLESVDSSAMSALCRQAKVVVNLNASNGSRERLFEAMNAGAAVVSEKSAVSLNTLKMVETFSFLTVSDRAVCLMLLKNYWVPIAM